jgi:hypothetical protein
VIARVAKRARLAAILLPAAACAPSHGAAYERAFAEASRAEGAGRMDEAVRDYDRAAALATRARDREQARWDAVDTLLRAGADRADDALSRLDAIAADPSNEHAAEAAYRAASLRIDRGDAARGWREMELAARRFSTHGVAHVAVRRVVEHAAENGPRATQEELRSLEGDLASTEVEPLIAFLSAEQLEQLGEDAAARAAYIRIAERWPYPFGGFFDDALWRASLLDEKLGFFARAVEDLERMVAVRETTTLIGTYERPKYVPAMLRIGELWRDRLHDRARAREAFHRLYTDFAHSTARDRALWLEAALWRDDGDAHTACGRLALLVHDFPDSRYVPCATQLCSDVERPRDSSAPKECHPYITRQNGDALPTPEGRSLETRDN